MVLGDGKFTNLIKLNAFGNDFTSLPEFVGGLFENLEILHVNIGKLESIPSSIENLTKLNRISLSKNNLVELPEELVNLDLNSLKIGENVFTDYPENSELIDCIEGQQNYDGTYEDLFKISYFKRSVFSINPTYYNEISLPKLRGCLKPNYSWNYAMMII